MPVLPSTRSPDRHHQTAQHHAHGYVQQPIDAVFHTGRSSPLPACRTGPTRSLSGRQLPTLSNRAVSLARGLSPPTGGGPEARFQSTSTDGASLRYPTLDQLPPADVPALPRNLAQGPWTGRQRALRVQAPARCRTRDCAEALSQSRIHRGEPRWPTSSTIEVHDTCQRGSACPAAVSPVFTVTNAGLRPTDSAAPQVFDQIILVPDVSKLRDLRYCDTGQCDIQGHKESAAEGGASIRKGARG